jgi:Uma2 family endonuclease
MSSPARVRPGMTLAEFLKLPEDKPYLEYIDGRIEAKVSPQLRHSMIAVRMMQHLNQSAEPARLGTAFPELRCVFAGRAIIPDITFLLEPHIPTDEQGLIIDETLIPPDIHIEIVSPEQSPRRSREKLAHSTAHGCALGWLIDPERLTIDVYRPGCPPERLGPDGALTGEPVLPGFRVTVAEVFGWLRHRPGPAAPGGPATGADPA